jgi:hypothetical protein
VVRPRAIHSLLLSALLVFFFPAAHSVSPIFFPSQVQEQLRFLPQVKHGGNSAPVVATASSCSRKQKQNVIFFSRAFGGLVRNCGVSYCCKSVSSALKTIRFAESSRLPESMLLFAVRRAQNASDSTSRIVAAWFTAAPQPAMPRAC